MEFIKTFLIPGSRWFLLVSTAVGVALLYGPRSVRRFARLWLTALVVGYWAIALPVISDRLASAFHTAKPQSQESEAASRASAIVVLGSGVESFGSEGRDTTVPLEQTALNAFTAARLYQMAPKLIVASGGIVDPSVQRAPESEVLRDLLIRSGVPGRDIVLESASRTTHEQAVSAAQLLRSHHLDRPVLVTSPVHMLRAIATLRAQGIDATPFPARFRSELADPSSAWLPNGSALKASEIAIYDYFGWVYYWLRGWTAGSRDVRPKR
jgi:uncharacterized SAM-binding protein YcdF (DUF218 family)